MRAAGARVLVAVLSTALSARLGDEILAWGRD